MPPEARGARGAQRHTGRRPGSGGPAAAAPCVPPRSGPRRARGARGRHPFHRRLRRTGIHAAPELYARNVPSSLPGDSDAARARARWPASPAKRNPQLKRTNRLSTSTTGSACRAPELAPGRLRRGARALPDVSNAARERTSARAGALARWPPPREAEPEVPHASLPARSRSHNPRLWKQLHCALRARGEEPRSSDEHLELPMAEIGDPRPGGKAHGVGHTIRHVALTVRRSKAPGATQSHDPCARHARAAVSLPADRRCARTDDESKLHNGNVFKKSFRKKGRRLSRREAENPEHHGVNVAF